MSTHSLEINWQEWLRRWDMQQTGYLPDRELRFQVMLDALEILFPPSFVALDLACGPGSLSQRLLTRFPDARCIALDLDPVLLTLGRNVLGDMQGRLRWVEADIRDPAWCTQLGETHVDAVLSTTALHWLPPESIVSLYQELAAVIHPGGVFLNGDHLRFAPHMSHFRNIAATFRQRREETFLHDQRENWQQWWQALKQEPALKNLFAERERRFAWRPHEEHREHTLDLHEAALRNAGFREVGVLWQHLDNRVIMGIR